MEHEIHDNISGWLEASIKGRLSASQRQALRQHLGDCDTCLREACRPALVNQAVDTFSRWHGPAPGFEGRVLEGFRGAIAVDREWRPVVCRKGFRVALRVGLATILLGLIVLRELNVHYVQDDSWSGKALSAANLVFLRTPSCDTIARLPATLGQHERQFAVAHQLTKGCAGMVMWISFLTLCSCLLLDVWRRRFHLSRE